MKKKLMFLLLVLLSMTQLSAQDDYVPFVREGVKWVCYFNSYHCSAYNEFEWARYYLPGKTYFNLELKGDTVINGKPYMKMHKYSGDCINEQNDTVIMCLREEDRTVYGIMPYLYPGFYVGYGIWTDNPDVNIIQAALSGEEFILYDFNDPDSYYNTIYTGTATASDNDLISYIGCDEVPVGDKMSKRYRFNYGNYLDFCFIEGVGYDGYINGYTLGYLYMTRNQILNSHYDGFFLSHVEEDGRIIYKGINYEQVMPIDGRLPIVQEGKIWVNERVIINKGDTTRSYYFYETSGNDPRYPSSDFMLCHYYTDMKNHSEDDSIISILTEPIVSSAVYSYYNWPLVENMESNRTIYRPTVLDQENSEYVLYWIEHGNIEKTISNYVYRRQTPKVLTMENFVAVEPVEIDGIMCDRYAYLDENGEPKAYLIEGIGFDSRDMGDLLTPFTLPPDPDADYQEWCGLSHVIKDGEIIYKGMCYDAERVQEAMAIGQPGDVNGDGIVNVTDVTLLIDMVINSSSQGSYILSGDMDHNGEVNVTDVVRLINLVIQE